MAENLPDLEPGPFLVAWSAAEDFDGSGDGGFRLPYGRILPLGANIQGPLCALDPAVCTSHYILKLPVR